jgi:hypothetical protein
MGRSPRRPRPRRDRVLRCPHHRAPSSTKSSCVPQRSPTTTTTTSCVHPAHELQSTHWPRHTLNYRLRVFRLHTPPSTKSQPTWSFLHTLRRQRSRLRISQSFRPTHPNQRINPRPSITKLEPNKLNVTSNMDG